MFYLLVTCLKLHDFCGKLADVFLLYFCEKWYGVTFLCYCCWIYSDSNIICRLCGGGKCLGNVGVACKSIDGINNKKSAINCQHFSYFAFRKCSYCNYVGFSTKKRKQMSQSVFSAFSVGFGFLFPSLNV